MGGKNASKGERKKLFTSTFNNKQQQCVNAPGCKANRPLRFTTYAQVLQPKARDGRARLLLLQPPSLENTPWAPVGEK